MPERDLARNRPPCVETELALDAVEAPLDPGQEVDDVLDVVLVVGREVQSNQHELLFLLLNGGVGFVEELSRAREPKSTIASTPSSSATALSAVVWMASGMVLGLGMAKGQLVALVSV